MKKLIFFAFLFIFTMSSFAQSADEQISEAINTGDFFRLDERYSKLKEEIRSPMLKAFTEALLNATFNRPQEAIASIDSLVTYYQEEIGFGNVKSMLEWQNHILFRMGEYCDASTRASNFLEQVAPYLDKETVNSLRYNYKFYHSMCGQKKSELIRPDEDCIVPLYIEPVEVKNARKGNMLYVPVKINGKEERFIFDTGCPGGVFLSEEYARKLGTKITFDSLSVSGAGGSGMGKMGILESLSIGNMTFRNLSVTVVPPNMALDTVFKIDKVLGSDIMLYAGEVQIYPKQKKIIFPVNKTPLPTTGRNMIKTQSDGFLVKTYSGNERVIMILDTGDSASGLNSSYYHKNKKLVEGNGKKESLLSGGFGGVHSMDYYNIPVLPLQIGDRKFDMKNIYVDTQPDSPVYLEGGQEGSLGMAFISLFDKVTISFDHMFIEVK